MSMKAKYFLFLFLLLINLSCADALSGNREKEKELFNKIHVGMSKNEVENILGKADNESVDSSSNNTLYRYYFTKNKSGMRSSYPVVIFDSLGKVKFSSYGDGG